MLFLLDFEDDFDFITQDSLIYKQQLDKRKPNDTYQILKAKDFYCEKSEKLKSKEDFPISYRSAVPIGSIQFVEAFLKIFHSIEHEKPFEIPLFMQNDFFLKREYKICKATDIPKKGNYFIKDVSIQKHFSYIGDVEKLLSINPKAFNPNHYYLVSGLQTILSEYRVYVANMSIINISFYSGDPTIFPDIEFIKEAVDCFGNNINSPKSFSMDFMVTSNGTAVLEIHSYLSLGLYWTKWNETLIDAYIDSFFHIIKQSKALDNLLICE